MLLLGLVNLVDHVDMAIIRGVAPFVQEEFALTDFQLGTLGSAFVLVNGIATIPAGWLADHVRRTRLIGYTLMSWSGLILLSATAQNYLNMLFARSVMGVGQSIDDPASSSLLADYYPPAKRAQAFSYQQIALFAGGGLGIALGGFVGTQFGWRWAFVLVGMPGSLLAFLVFRLREPYRGEADLREAGKSMDEIAQRAEAAASPLDPRGMGFRPFLRLAWTQLSSEIRMIFRIRTMRYILVGVSALLFTVSGIGFWLAVYHQRYSGMTELQATAVTGGLLIFAGLAGTIGGGIVSDRVAQRITGGRIVLVVWSATACAVLFLISFAVPNVPLRLALQFVGVLGAAAAVPGLRASMMDVVPADSRGVGASAFALTSTVFGTAAAPVIVGQLSDLTGSLVWAFTLVFPPVIAGLMLLLRARRTIGDDAEAILVAMVAEQEALAAEAEEAGLGDGDHVGGPTTPEDDTDQG
ncbi:MAG: MFS transporter [Acidimicrobiia bacterium]|nr:MFS transporter [Acidimicrobiia bacterium]